MNSSISNFKKSGKKILADLLVLVFFLFLFDRLLFLAIRRAESRFYRGISSYSLQDKFAQAKGKGEYQVLILGTSRTFDGIHPWYIQNELGVRSFKEAFVGKGPMYNYFFYQEYKKYMGIPRVVIYGLDYFLFNITSERHWMKRFNSAKGDAGYFAGGPSLLLANKPKIDEFNNAFLNSLKKSSWDDPNYLLERDLAQMEAYRGVVSPGKIDVVEPSRFPKINFFGFPGVEGEYFLRLLKQLQRDGVQVLLVSLPEYIGTYWTNHNQKRFLGVFTKFAKYHKGVFFYNYDLPEKFDLANAEFFIDGGFGKTNSHLSRAGSEIFNRLLVRDLRQFIEKK
jgi:hypothetical protein